jgi:hypothetical protein
MRGPRWVVQRSPDLACPGLSGGQLALSRAMVVVPEFVLDCCEPLERRRPPMPIVEDLKVLEDRISQLDTRPARSSAFESYYSEASCAECDIIKAAATVGPSCQFRAAST